MTDPSALLIDYQRSICLCDVGAPGYRAVVAVDTDGGEYLLLAQVDRINDETARADTDCLTAEHEQPGPLPLQFVRRIDNAQETP